MAKLLVVNNLKKNFGQKNVLNGVSIQMGRNEFVSIIGESGSGKSTLVKVLSGLNQPTSGEVIICDTNIVKLAGKDLNKFRNKNIGIIFDSFKNLISDRSVIGNMGMSNLHNKEDIEQQALEVLELVGLKHKRHQLLNQLIGEERQLVAIAKALVLRPKILFADEPTNALNQFYSEYILDLFNELRRIWDISILMFTQDKNEAVRAERFLYLEDGILKG